MTEASAYPGFEDRLVQNLQPIRGFALASALYHVFDLGISDAILDQPPQGIFSLANQYDLDPKRLEGLLLFLQVEGFVRVEAGLVKSSDKLAGIREAWPWYEMLIGGYAQTYLDMGKGLRAGSGVLSRNGVCVGAGSCKISHYDAIPLTRELLRRLPDVPKKIVDLGCGDALYLSELCSVFPNLVAIGVEPEQHDYTPPTANIESDPRDDRIRIYQATAQDFIDDTEERDVDALILAFVLHEILGQNGRQGAVAFLKKVTAKFPDAHIVVIEVEPKAADLERMGHPLAKSYYNPYYLVHYFTDQELQSQEFWLELFAEAGLRLVTQATTDPDVDSTGLELGFLLSCSASPRAGVESRR